MIDHMTATPKAITERAVSRAGSVAKLAAELGVTRAAVYHWLSGRSIPGGPAFILMCGIASGRAKRRIDAPDTDDR